LRLITPADVIGCGVEDPWRLLYLFGQEDYAKGGGASPFLGVHGDTGEIMGLDVEREASKMFLLNSNIDRYIRTFQKFDEVLRLKTLAPRHLPEALREIDGDTFQHGEWRLLCDYIMQ